MQVVELNCPHCSTRLRLRDQRFVGRTIHCPDCAQPVGIVRNAAGAIEAIVRPAGSPPGSIVNEEPESDAHVSPAQSEAVASADVIKRLPTAAATPRRVAWGLAALLSLAVVIYALTGDRGRPSPSPEPIAEVDPLDRPPTPDVDPQPVPQPQQAERQPAAGPQTLAEWVIAYRDRHGHYPLENPLARPLPEVERIGWIAELAADHDPSGPQPVWDRPIDDPLNSRFVRRRLDPLLTSHGPAAANGLPATHYVGVSGVGADAAALPKIHPRAGIFGDGRSTTIDDVRDGLANTLLIVGVSSQPAPWASGGPATMRALTAEPYVNGPDGFGTGQPDGMFVALADGSVRLLSSEIAPTIVRRMAAMADGLPLDETVPGEPGDSPPNAMLAQPGHVRPANPALPAVPVPHAVDPVADQPIEPQLAADFIPPPPPSYNVAQALEQPIVRFSQRRPVALQVLLDQLEELAGVPIELQGLEIGVVEELLTREVTLDVADTTVGGILSELLKQVGLTYVTGKEFGIRVVSPGA